MSRARPRIAVIWRNFGPYHLARVRALSTIGDVLPIELAGHQRLYGWRSDRTNELPISTLAKGALEDQRQVTLALRMWRTLDKVRPDITLVPGYADAASVSAALWCRERGALVVLMSETTADDQPRRKLKEFVKRQIVRHLFKYAIVGGRRSAQYMKQLGVSEHRICYYYDVVDNEFYGANTKGLRQTTESGAFGLPNHYFLFVGRQAPEKNILRLLEAFDRYCSVGGSWDLVLVGRGPLVADIKKAAENLKCAQRIVHAGFRNGSELLPFYAFASCFVLPSVREAWGLVVNEAMASGLPVLASACCGCTDELIHSGENGFTFDPYNVGELVGRMLAMERIPPVQRDAMGENSARIIQRFSPAGFAQEVARCLNIALADGRQ